MERPTLELQGSEKTVAQAPTKVLPLLERWRGVRGRISQIGEKIREIELEMDRLDDEKFQLALLQLAGCQRAFESVMTSLAEFDDSDEQVRYAVESAKHDFVRVVQRYQYSRWTRLDERH